MKFTSIDLLLRTVEKHILKTRINLKMIKLVNKEYVIFSCSNCSEKKPSNTKTDMTDVNKTQEPKKVNRGNKKIMSKKNNNINKNMEGVKENEFIENENTDIYNMNINCSQTSLERNTNNYSMNEKSDLDFSFNNIINKNGILKKRKVKRKDEKSCNFRIRFLYDKTGNFYFMNKIQNHNHGPIVTEDVSCLVLYFLL